VHDGVPDTVLVIVNLAPDEVREATVHLDLGAVGLGDRAAIEVRDELTGETWTWGPAGNYVRLDPAERVAHLFTVS
jgi:starch synthase (maltosyl-transferring)